MKRLKYIIDNYKNFVIFSDGNSHEDMAKGFYFKPVSAGFCTIDVDYETGEENNQYEKLIVNIHCFGESISLGLKSKEEDEKIINSLIQH